MRESIQIPRESGRIRNSPREYDKIWANSERKGETPEESERIRENSAKFQENRT